MINYKNIVAATDYYEQLGYKYVDVPWFVSTKAISATLPSGRRLCQSHIGNLVGSGEQSFIEMWLNGDLKLGTFQCATPCFRDEILTETNHNYFFKVELINVLGLDATQSDITIGLNKVINDSCQFFMKMLDNQIEVVETDIGWDIYSKGVELGSYGYRMFQDMRWIYGTGCAEPRLSYVLSKGK
jgi:hypothetical protein